MVGKKDGGSETSSDAASQVDDSHGVPSDVLLYVSQNEHLKDHRD